MVNQNEIAASNFITSLMGNGIMMILARTAGLIFTVIGAKILGVEQLGTLLITLGYMTLLSTITAFGIPAAIPHFVTRANLDSDKHQVSELLQTSAIIVLVSSIITALVGYACADFLSNIIYGYNSSSYLKIASLTIPLLSVVKVITGVLRGLDKTVIAAFIELTLMRTLYLAVLLVAFVFEQNLNIILVLIVVVLLIRLAFATYFVREFLQKPEINFKNILNHHSLTYVSNTWITSITLILRTRGDIVIIGALLNPVKAALFGVGLSLASFLLMTSKIVGPAYRPVATKFVMKNQYEELKRYYGRIVELDLSIIIPLACFLGFFSNQIIESIFGAEYAEASTVFIIVSAGYVCSAVFGPVNSTLLAYGATSVIRDIDISASLIFLALFSVLTYFFGLNGASIAVSLTWALQNFAKYKAVQKHLSLSNLFSQKMIVYTIIMMSLAYTSYIFCRITEAGLVTLLIIFFSYIGLSTIICILLKIVYIHEIKKNLSVFGNKLSRKLSN